MRSAFADKVNELVKTLPGTAMPSGAKHPKHRKLFAFVLSAVDGRYKVLTKQTLAALSGLGPVFKTQIGYRRQWIQALVIGRTGPELDKDLRPEIDALWGEVKCLAEKGGVQ